jgi:hypothetical protein
VKRLITRDNNADFNAEEKRTPLGKGLSKFNFQ